jgi:FkbM family methyltransferase
MAEAELSDAEAARVRVAVSCRDADRIEKVPEAGTVRRSDGVDIQVMHNGVLVVEHCYYGPMMTEIIRLLRGHHEPQEEVAFDAAVRRVAADGHDAVMVELGAHWAYYSLWFLEAVPGGRAICIEPDPTNLEVGRRNVTLNERTASFVQAAVGGTAGPPEPFMCEDGTERLVPTVSLASIVEDFALESIDLLLLDVQGAERSFLEGAADLLADRVRFIVVSTHHHSISGEHLTHQVCLQLLQSRGAHVFAEHTVAESFSGDGLIAASFDARDKDLSVKVSRARAADSLFGDPLAELAATEHERRVLEQKLRASGGSSLVRRLAGRLRAVRR